MNGHVNHEKDIMPQSSFGFRIRSSQHFKLLRSGGNNGTLEVRAEAFDPKPAAAGAVLEWSLKGSADVTAKLHFDEHLYDYWISDTGWYRIDPTARTIHIPSCGDELIREHRLWGIPTLLCAMTRGDFFVHAAAVEIGNEAILFAAPGRHGKTTLALAFHQHGYRVLSEDSACCRLEPSPVLLPGPALMRVRPDVFDGNAPPGAHIAAIYEDRIFMIINEDRRGNDDPVPIRGLCLLRESPDAIHVDHLSPQKALRDLWALSFRFPNDLDRGRCFTQLCALAATVPIWELYRPLRLDCLSETIEAIVKTFS
jgi:hypothetical protein